MKTNIRALIVDDEELAREELNELLKAFPEVEVVGDAEDADSAIELINLLNPDVIFLDIQMPGKTGFELIEMLDTQATIIFVTAYDEYAIKAFEINALDYLIKPVYPARLAKTIARLTQPDAEETKPKPLDYEDFIFVKTSSKVKFVKIKEIMCISSAREYTEIFTSTGLKALVHKSMNEWEDRLPESHFLRIHRTSIINLNYIQKITDSISNAHDVYIEGIEKPFGMSQRYYAKIRKRLQ